MFYIPRRSSGPSPSAWGQAMRDAELAAPQTAVSAKSFAVEVFRGVGTAYADYKLNQIEGLKQTGQKVTKEEYENADWRSPNIQWEEGMTKEAAIALKEYDDEVRARQKIIAESSTTQKVLGFGVALVAGTFEFKNMAIGLATSAAIPMVGFMAPAASSLRRLSQIRNLTTKGKIGYGAGTGLVSAAIAEPSNYDTAKRLQQDYTIADSAFNILTSTLFGVAVEAAAPAFRSAKSAASEFWQAKKAKFGGKAFDVVADEFDLATHQLLNGQKVDVSAVEVAAKSSVNEPKKILEIARDEILQQERRDILPKQFEVESPDDLEIKAVNKIEKLPDQTSQLKAAEIFAGSDWNLEGRSSQTQKDLTNPKSVVIREKETGKVVFETDELSILPNLNRQKYEAVPIIEHLANLNGQTFSKSPDALAKAQRVKAQSLGENSLNAVVEKAKSNTESSQAKATAAAIDPLNDTALDMQAAESLNAYTEEPDFEAMYQEMEADIKRMADDGIINEADLQEYRNALDDLRESDILSGYESLRICLTRG